MQPEADHCMGGVGCDWVVDRRGSSLWFFIQSTAVCVTENEFKVHGLKALCKM